MDAEKIDVHSIKTEIKSEQHDDPDEFPLSEEPQMKEESFKNSGGQLYQYSNELMIRYKPECIKFEEADVKSEISELCNFPNTLFQADSTSEKDINYVELKSEICGYQDHVKTNLNAHLACYQHEERIPKHECKECGFKTALSSSLKRHLHHHRNSNKLKLYLYKPSNQNVECPNCDYQTNDRSNLRRHIIYHCVSSSAMRPCQTYICYHCGHNASKKSNLQVHIFRKHRPKEEVKQHCEECSYQPVSKNDLQIHKLTHENAKHMKVYNCFYCKYQTIYKVSIDRHMISHKSAHEIDMYQCYLCPYKAVRKDELRNHILRHAKKSKR